MLGPQEAAAGCASSIPGFCCNSTAEGVRVSADFPGQLAVITAWRVSLLIKQMPAHIVTGLQPDGSFQVALQAQHLGCCAGKH